LLPQDFSFPNIASANHLSTSSAPFEKVSRLTRNGGTIVSARKASGGLKEINMPVGGGIRLIVWLVTMVVGTAVAFGAYAAMSTEVAGGLAATTVELLTIVIAFTLASAVRMVNQWQRALVLRLGKFSGVRGPGLFFITPVFETIPYVIDLRTITTSFRAEQTITSDTVPVDVDAVLFWRVSEPQRAALEVEKYADAVAMAAQTALRDVIGRATLAQILSERQTIDKNLSSVIDARTSPWGINVQSVELRDVKIPPELQAAMSRQAQAERERQARVILGESEVQIAERFNEAAKVYADNPTALHLRAMNMLYEGLKERGALMIVPSSALDSMSLGNLSGMAALGRGTAA
jgi:regulator of protease activity HflC (stomatin/prohibitin superfamily)